MTEHVKCEPDEVDFDFMQFDGFREEAKALFEGYSNVPLSSKLSIVAQLAEELKKG